MSSMYKQIDGKLVQIGGKTERDNLRPKFEILTQSQYNSLAGAKSLDKNALLYIVDDNIDNTKEIKRTKCEHCGAALNLDKITDNGLCRCEYCRIFNYVW